jgi:acyl-CoA synthetase (AMP-forming)/AMP-acid ligase II
MKQVLWSHPAIRDCAVIGTPDPKWGEAVTAVIELKDGKSVEDDDLLAFCRERLGSMKTPKRIETWDELPRSPIGKVLKREVRDRFWQEQDRAV